MGATNERPGASALLSEPGVRATIDWYGYQDIRQVADDAILCRLPEEGGRIAVLMMWTQSDPPSASDLERIHLLRLLAHWAGVRVLVGAGSRAALAHLVRERGALAPPVPTIFMPEPGADG